MRKRNHRVAVRYSDDEYQLLQQKISESGQTMQDFMLNCSLGARLTTADDHKILLQEASFLADMDKQLRGIGTNINQIAHHANLAGYIHDQNMLNEIANVVVSVRDEVYIKWQLIRASISHRRM